MHDGRISSCTVLIFNLYSLNLPPLYSEYHLQWNLIKILVPPSAPILYVTSATSSSILLHWKAGFSGGAAITQYILNFKKSSGEQDELLLPRRISSYELKVSALT